MGAAGTAAVPLVEALVCGLVPAFSGPLTAALCEVVAGAVRGPESCDKLSRTEEALPAASSKGLM